MALEERLRRERWCDGFHDCGTVVCRVVNALTNVDLTRYVPDVDKRGLLHEANRIARLLGFPRTNNTDRLGRGDPVVIRDPVNQLLPSLGFVTSRGRVAVASADGLDILARDTVSYGWVVPCHK